MINTRIKGLKKELLCANELKAQGFEIWFRSTTVKRGPCWVGLDIAHVFDILAAHPERGIYFVSVKHKSSGHFTEHIAEIQSLFDTYGFHFRKAQFEIWIWNPPAMKGSGEKKRQVGAHWQKIRIWDGAPIYYTDPGFSPEDVKP